MVVLLHRRNMKPLQQFYFNMQMFLFPAMEEEIGEMTGKMQEFVMLVELLKPGRFIPDALLGGVLGRPRRSRERLLRAFLLKAVYNFPTTDMLVENLRTSPQLHRLCGWDFACEIPSRATFCRAFGEFAEAGLGERLHEAMVAENYKDKIVGHASHDSTEIDGRERACRRKAPESPAKRKRGRPRKAEKTAAAIADKAGKRVELQPQRTLAENLADRPKVLDDIFFVRFSRHDLCPLARRRGGLKKGGAVYAVSAFGTDVGLAFRNVTAIHFGRTTDGGGLGPPRGWRHLMSGRLLYKVVRPLCHGFDVSCRLPCLSWRISALTLSGVR